MKIYKKINAVIKYWIITKMFILCGVNAFVVAKPSQQYGFIVSISRR